MQCVVRVEGKEVERWVWCTENIFLQRLHVFLGIIHVLEDKRIAEALKK